MSRVHVQMLRVTTNNLFEQLFARVPAYCGSPDMSVSGDNVKDGDELGQVSPQYEKRVYEIVLTTFSILEKYSKSFYYYSRELYEVNISAKM